MDGATTSTTGNDTLISSLKLSTKFDELDVETISGWISVSQTTSTTDLISVCLSYISESMVHEVMQIETLTTSEGVLSVNSSTRLHLNNLVMCHGVSTGSDSNTYAVIQDEYLLNLIKLRNGTLTYEIRTQKAPQRGFDLETI